MKTIETKITCYDIMVLKDIAKSLPPSPDSRYLRKMIVQFENDKRREDEGANKSKNINS